ncbi:MAG: hypothetical protein AAF184_16415 [Pseudomonadota bacterium]
MNRTNRIARWPATLSLLLALGASTGANALHPNEMVIREHAAESPYLDLALTSTTSGTIRTRRCDQCPELTLRVDSNTVASQGGRRLTLSQAELNRDRGATVFYDPKSLVVTRILLRQ